MCINNDTLYKHCKQFMKHFTMSKQYVTNFTNITSFQIFKILLATLMHFLCHPSSSVVNHFFKQHLLLNHIANYP